jgi:hypothetical protein
MRNALLCALAGLAAGVTASSMFRDGAPEAPLAEPPHAQLVRVPPAPSASRPVAAPLEQESPVEPPAPSAAAHDEADIVAAGDQEPAGGGDRIATLTAVGFTPTRAAAILRREAELRRAPYLAEYETSGTVRALGRGARSSAAAALRAELGDADYERYLEGTGQPRSVVVRGIETDSAAAHAGILPGDEIRAYAGQRVFNQRDLNSLMLAGTPGEVVATTVVRDGLLLELYVTRGPLGLL